MLASGLIRFLMAPLIDEIYRFRTLRGAAYGLLMHRAGRRVQICSSAIIWGAEHLTMGDDVYIGPGVKIICLESVTIGDGVLLGPNVVISNGNHEFSGGAYRYDRNSAAPVSIGAGSWIGANATVLAGATIGRGVLVAANAAVTKDVPDYSIAGGVPAKVIGSRPATEVSS